MFKYALRIALGILAVVAILALSLNFYLGLSGPQSRLQAKASRALGTPVLWAKMEGINVLRGASVLDFRIPGEGPEGHPPLLQAPKVEVAYSLSDLLDSRLVLPKLWFYQPVLALPEDAEGRLILPLHPPKKTPAAASSSPGADPNQNQDPSKAAAQPWPLTLSSFAIVGGRLR
ncbi:MAG TPA: hypothetical protein VIM58_00060, partial [Candidatus Methylacidiphilales bacterium]